MYEIIAYILNCDGESPRLKDIPVIKKKIPDLFPEELLGLPQTREVEVSINTFLEVSPIAQQPYWMALTELIELKIQLHDLLDKGFI